MNDFSKVNHSLPPEQQAIRDECVHPTGTFVEFPIEDVETSIPARFAKIVAEYPDRIAVKFKQHELTYDKLNQTANCVAQAVLSHVGLAQKPVALLFDNDDSIISAIMGVLKSGKIYVPLDPSYPRARILSILENSEAMLILTNSKNLSFANDVSPAGCRVLNVNELDTSDSMATPGLSIPPDSPANILYTSGSTGQPKGVIQTHRNILHEIMNYTNGVHICAADRLALLSSPSFADAVRTIYGALLNGAALYPLDLKEEGLTKLGSWLIQQEVTIYRSVPSVIRHFVDTLTGKEQFLSLRLIYSAGDSASWSDIKSYKKYFSPNCIFVNGLGSTESLTFRWYFIDKETPITAGSVPVGYAVGDKEVLLVDDHGNEVGSNQVGHIAVRSHYLSPGYWRRPDLTKAAFLSNVLGIEKRNYLTGDIGRKLPDGCLMHLGRKDFQVKIRGRRIEVAEIEQALLNLNTIKEAVVVAREDHPGDRRLVAYIAPTQHPGPAVSAMRRELAATLPDYMIPSTYVWVDALPLSPNKKVDRRALPDPNELRPDLDTPFAVPRTSVEEAIAKFWSDVLCVDRVGVNDNFFELGGHSLAAARVVSRLMRTFHLELPIKVLFESPTVADMTMVITQNQAKLIGQVDLARTLGELESISDEEAERLLASAREDERQSIDGQR